MSQQIMLQIAKKNDAAAMAQFMVTMAEETQKIKLDQKLVTRAVQYLIQSDYGQTLIKRVNGVPVAAMFLTFQNEKIWWISSVFVTKPFRGKGIFSQLFQYAQNLAVSKGIKYIRLYAEQSNSKAKKTYMNMGMILTNENFFGYDLIMDQQILFLDNPLLKVKKMSNQSLDLEGMLNLCEMQVGKNKGLACYLNDQLQGYCQYFLEFSEWRFGLTVYISTLFIKTGQIGKEVLTQFFEYLRRYQDLKVSTLRIVTQTDGKQLMMIAPKIKRLSYDILEIKLQNIVPKL